MTLVDGEKPRILIVDDEPGQRDALRDLLASQSYRIETAGSGGEALEKVCTLLPDLVLMDVMMPDMTGFEACWRMRQDARVRDVPILMVTSLDDRESRLQGLNAGADDFIVRPYDRIELKTRVRGVLRLNRFRRMAEDRAELERRANFDELTGLPNRYLCLKRLEEGVRSGNPTALIKLGLDRLKRINETLGMEAGDRVLRTIAARLAQLATDGQTAGRLASDEFLLLVPVGDQEAAAALARRALEEVSRSVDIDGASLVVTPSVGVAVWPADGADAAALLRGVDMAMHRAKEEGGARVQRFSADMVARARTRLGIEARLRSAIGTSDLCMHFQAQVNLSSGEIVGSEALVRWRDGGRGMVSPMEFIPIAEETGLITQLGVWAFKCVCAQQRAWLDDGVPVAPVAVNVSARQFHETDLVAECGAALAASGLSPGLLHLELTESVTARDPERVRGVIEALRALGIAVSVDDFGTGYSSLSRLRTLPLDVVKVDRAFVGGLPDSTSDAALVKAIVGMSHALGFRVLAEGVETVDQASYLRTLGCEFMQGYLFSKPLPPAEFASLLVSGRRLEVRTANAR